MEVIDEIKNPAWKIFLKDHPQGNIFQTPEMFEVYQNTKNYEPIIIGATDKNDSIVGVLLAIIQKEHKGFFGKFSSRSIIIGGPIVKNNDPEILDFLLKEYNKGIKGKAIYTQIRNLFDQSWAKEVYEKNGFNYDAHLDILIDLTHNPEKLWNNLDSKARNKIRKAEKNDVKFEAVYPSLELGDISYNILKEVYQHAKLPLSDKSLFNSVFKILGESGMVKVFTAVKEGKIIGVRIGFLYKNMIYDWYAGSLRSFYKFNPNDFLPYNILCWGHNNDYQVFDFGGAGKPNIPYGVRDHKMKFGGELVEFGRFEKTHNRLLMKVGESGFKLYKLVKR